MTKRETTRIRPMTEQEKAVFHTIPDGACKYPDSESWNKACQYLSSIHAVFEAGGNHPGFGVFWTYEKPKGE